MKRHPQGFTLIEIMLVVVIIGILAAVVLPRLTGRTEQARLTAAAQQIESFGVALEAFYLDCGRFPTTGEGLDALRTRPPVLSTWRGPYLKRAVPADPWGRPYGYASPGVHNPDYDMKSSGPDGVEGTADDITNWENKKSSK